MRGCTPTLLITAALALTGCPGEQGPARGRGPGAAPPAAVTVAEAVRKAVPVELRGIGMVEANASVTVKAQVSGALTAVHFREGQEVRKGEALCSIDPRAFQAELDRAEAALARDRAQLANAEREAARQAELLAKRMTSEEAADQAKTAVSVLAASVTADTAALVNARLNREYCAVTSPIDGRAGARLLDAGNLVKAGETALAVVNQIRPAQVSFTLPQQNLPEIRARQAAGQLKVRALLPGQANAVEGELTFVDNAVDRSTGTIRLKAEFPNADERLWPGQFVTAVLTLRVQPDALVVPTQAVQAGQQGQFVFVVTPELTAESRRISVDRVLGDLAVVTGELQPGERVVTDGQLLLAPNAKVTIKDRPPGGAPSGRPGPSDGGPGKDRVPGSAPRGERRGDARP